MHEHVDSGVSETRKKIRYERGVYVSSERYNLVGKLDLLEIDLTTGILTPVEYKKGKHDISDLVQLTAQVLCLEEMNNIDILKGVMWSYSTRKRTNIEITAELRNTTIEIIENTSKILDNDKAPTASYKRVCKGCSLFDICQPLLIENDKSAMYIKNLFKGVIFEDTEK